MEAPSKSKVQDKFSIFSLPKKKKWVVSLLSSKMSCSSHNFYCAFILLTLEEIGTSSSDSPSFPHTNGKTEIQELCVYPKEYGWLAPKLKSLSRHVGS